MRYFGGKAKLASQISEYINNLGKDLNITQYAESFCGALNIASKVNIKNKILNDKNPYLIAMFKALQEGWIPPEIVTEEDYYLAKKNQDVEPHIAGFVGFACSFAAKFWGGYARDKLGIRNFASEGKIGILKKMKTLQDATFTCKDFLELDFENSIIYCDPPYKNTTPYYTQILGKFPYEEYLKWIKIQSKKNIVIASEYKHNVPDDSIILMEIPSKTDIRDKNGKAIETTEVIFTYNDLKKANNN